MNSTWTEYDIDIDGKQMHTVRTGPGGRGKPVLVLVHGFSDDGPCWTPTARDLADEYDIIMPDARGHGKSGRVQPGEVVDQTGDLAGLMQALGLEKAIVAGHSMGAWMASELAARFPELVRAVILEDAPWRRPRPEDSERSLLSKENPLAAWIRGMEGMTLDEIVARERGEHPTWSDEVLLSGDRLHGADGLAGDGEGDGVPDAADHGGPGQGWDCGCRERRAGSRAEPPDPCGQHPERGAPRAFRGVRCVHGSVPGVFGGGGRLGGRQFCTDVAPQSASIDVPVGVGATHSGNCDRYCLVWLLPWEAQVWTILGAPHPSAASGVIEARGSRTGVRRSHGRVVNLRAQRGEAFGNCAGYRGWAGVRAGCGGPTRAALGCGAPSSTWCRGETPRQGRGVRCLTKYTFPSWWCVISNPAAW